MMATGIFAGALAGLEEIERRPYHENCDCALHNHKGCCSCRLSSTCNRISYPYRGSWSCSSLAFGNSPRSSSLSPVLNFSTGSKGCQLRPRCTEKCSSRRHKSCGDFDWSHLIIFLLTLFLGWRHIHMVMLCYKFEWTVPLYYRGSSWTILNSIEFSRNPSISALDAK